LRPSTRTRSARSPTGRVSVESKWTHPRPLCVAGEILFSASLPCANVRSWEAELQGGHRLSSECPTRFAIPRPPTARAKPTPGDGYLPVLAVIGPGLAPWCFRHNSDVESPLLGSVDLSRSRHGRTKPRASAPRNGASSPPIGRDILPETLRIGSRLALGRLSCAIQG